MTEEPDREDLGWVNDLLRRAAEHAPKAAPTFFDGVVRRRRRSTRQRALAGAALVTAAVGVMLGLVLTSGPSGSARLATRSGDAAAPACTGTGEVLTEGDDGLGSHTTVVGVTNRGAGTCRFTSTVSVEAIGAHGEVVARTSGRGGSGVVAASFLLGPHQQAQLSVEYPTRGRRCQAISRLEFDIGRGEASVAVRQHATLCSPDQDAGAGFRVDMAPQVPSRVPPTSPSSRG